METDIKKSEIITAGDNKTHYIPHNTILWFFLTLFLISCVLLGWLLWPFMSIIVLSAVVAGLFSPLFKYISKFNRISPSFASFLTCMIIFFVLFIPIVYCVGLLSKEASTLINIAKGAEIGENIKRLMGDSDLIEKINPYLSNFGIEFSVNDLNNTISEFFKLAGLFLLEHTKAIASNIFMFLPNFFFMLLITYFLLLDGEKLISFIIKLSPLPQEQDEKLISKFKDMSGAILIGNGLCGILQGTVGGIVFATFGLSSPFLWGVIMALLAFLPIVGIGAVFVPTAIILFLKGRIGTSLFFIGFYMILSGSVEYLLKPKLVGEQVKMHTLIVFLSIMGGLKLFGILGIIYGPLIVTLFITLTDIYYASYQKLVAPD